MKQLAVLAAFLLYPLTIIPGAAAASLDLGGRYGLPGFDNDRRRERTDRTGALLDLEKDLNLDGGIASPAAELTSSLGRHRLSFSYYHADSKGRDILDRSIVFNGRTFSLNEEVKTELNYDVYDFVYQYDLLDLENILAGFSAGVVGQVKLVDGQVERHTAGPRTTKEFKTTIPLVGMNLHMDILGDLLAGRVRATGMGYSEGSIFDGQAELSLTPNAFLDIHGGYRFFFIDLETNDVELDYGKSGPYLGITLSF